MRMNHDAAPQPAEIDEQLKRILASKRFRSSWQRSNTLSYLVTCTLKGDNPKEGVVRENVFPAYAPESNIVRVITSDLRNKFLPAYRDDFPDDPILIDIPPTPPSGSYGATFSYNRDPEALRLYDRGMYQMTKQTIDGCIEAVDRFSRSVELEPTYAPAHTALADAFFRCALLYPWQTPSWALNVMERMERKDLISRAQSSTETALKFKPQLWRAHVILGAVLACQFQWKSAEDAFQTALNISRSETLDAPCYVASLMATGAMDEALDLARRYAKGRPADPFGAAFRGLILYASGRRQELPFDTAEHDHWVRYLVSDLTQLDDLNHRVQYYGLYPLDQVEYERGYLRGTSF